MYGREVKSVELAADNPPKMGLDRWKMLHRALPAVKQSTSDRLKARQALVEGRLAVEGLIGAYYLGGPGHLRYEGILLALRTAPLSLSGRNE